MTIDLVTASADRLPPLSSGRSSPCHRRGVGTLTLENVKVFAGSTIRDNHLGIDGVLHPPRKAFALDFTARRAPGALRRMQTLRHPTRRGLRCFVSPSAQDHDGMLYESVFN